MKIFFENIRNGGSIDLIKKIPKDFDIVVLEEFQPCVKDKYEKILKLKGYTYFKGPDVTIDRGICNSTYIASKTQLSCKYKPKKIYKVKQFWEEVELNNRLFVLAVYVPCGNGCYSKYKKTIWDEIIVRAELAVKQKQKLVIIGDFNTVTKGDYTGEPTSCASYINKIKSLGFVDTWKRFNSNDEDRWTYITQKGDKRRIDYSFCSPELENDIISAKHIHDFRLAGLTDHSAIAIELL